MESIRKRFLAPNPLSRQTSAAVTLLNPPPSLPLAAARLTSQPSQRRQGMPPIRLEISPTRSLSLQNSLLTLRDTQLGKNIISSTSSSELKFLCLQSVYQRLQSQSRSSLNATELSLVTSILQTFRTKAECLESITELLSTDPSAAGTMSSWIHEIWKSDSKDLDAVNSEMENHSDEDDDGSSFSDSDVQEVGRVRPITLRPRTRSTPAAHSVVKQEKSVMVNAKKRAPPEEPKETQSSPRVTKQSTVTKDSKLAESKARVSEQGNKFGGDDGTVVLEGSKKRTLPSDLNSENTPTHHIKRSKSAQVLRPSPSSLSDANTNFDLTNLPPSSENSLVFRLLSSVGNSDPPSFLDQFWHQTRMTFPPHVRASSTEEQLLFFFKEVEFLRHENTILRREEEERKRTMWLLGEKIKLLNQPVERIGGVRWDGRSRGEPETVSAADSESY